MQPQAFRFSNGFNTIFVQNNQNTSVGVINANGQYPRLQGLQITMPAGFRTVNNSALRADEGTPCGMVCPGQRENLSCAVLSELPL